MGVLIKDLFYYSIVGNFEMIRELYLSEIDFLDKLDELNRSVLYIAARSGYFYICYGILTKC